MRWALRQPTLPTSTSTRPTAGATSTNPPTSTGLIYLEPSGLRRGNAAAMNGALSAAAAQTAAVAVAQQISDDTSNTQSVTCTAGNLTRAFGIILRQVRVFLESVGNESVRTLDRCVMSCTHHMQYIAC